ncbi:hypothetical protein EKG38_24460 [Shewanella canadensis]|uniref:Uncharacterized protein n=1 Tax=Shewanella canadensis TaxID=271096 RepID=A0A3S0KWF3_9GAMM|nr:hypothetical protein [Shewanella canadensis]RTR35898.1 hypothetical protein EKG38_24460 [Shewanella canadensis]
MKTKQRLISSFTLEYHPLVASLLSEESTPQFSPTVIEHLHEHEIQLLLQTITLHVIPTTPDHYQLLTPEPLFALVRQHPSVQSQKVSLCEYQHSADNIEQVITTLMLTLPALQYNYQSSTLKTLAYRLNTAKSNPSPPTKYLPKKSQLALFAGVSPSAIRLDTNKLANNDDKGKA